MKRSFSLFILLAFFVCSIFATSVMPYVTGSKSVPPLQPFPRIVSVSSENQALPLVSVTISETK